MKSSQGDYYVGLDVSLRSVAVCVIDEDGRTLFERSVACEIDAIIGCLSDLPADGLRIGFEAGAMSQHLFFGLRAAGFDVICMEARQVNAALSAKRFTSSRTVAAHFGLTPRRYQSGEIDNPGRISKAGDADVRSALYAAANAMMMRSVASSEIKSWGLRLMRRKGAARPNGKWFAPLSGAQTNDCSTRTAKVASYDKSRASH